MGVMKNKFPTYFGLGALFLLTGFFPGPSRVPHGAKRQSARAPAALPWHTSARWRHGLIHKTPGVLTIDGSGVAFNPARGKPFDWRFEEIQTFDLSPRRLVLTGYQNRRWHLHGERRFRFDLESPVPPAVAAALARRVGKPSENGVPSRAAPVMATIPARHRTLGGGTNGILRFRQTGIDYVTRSGKGERSWRWADLETLARPNPYRFTVGAYRETFSFELKRPMSRELFDWLWNRVYGRGLAGLNPGKGAGQ